MFCITTFLSENPFVFAVGPSLLRFYRIIVFTPAKMPEIKKYIYSYSVKDFFLGWLKLSCIYVFQKPYNVI